MLKVLIVEDEDFERSALKFLINKYFSKILHVIGEAYNGKEALDKTLLLKPDVILMDISMPFMDGLEASEKIKAYNNDIEIIILTAFDKFEYAKKAIKCGISDYLVKPYSDKDFTSSLDALIKKMKDKSNSIIKHQRLSDNYNKVIPYIEKELITQIAFGDYSKLKDVEESFKLLEINPLRGCCIIIDNLNHNTFSEDSVSLVKNILKFVFDYVIGARFLGDLVFFVFDGNVENVIYGNKLDDIFNKIKYELLKSVEMNVRIEVGPIVKDAGKYNYSYNQAKLLLRNKEYTSDKKDNQNYNFDYYEIDDNINIISGKIINEDLNGALLDAKNLLDVFLSSNNYIDLISLKNNLFKIIVNIRKNVLDFIDGNDSKLILDEIQIEIDGLFDLSDFISYFDLFLKEMYQNIMDYRNENNLSIIISAKKYIENNYMKDIRLDDVAKEVCISSYHFSRIFKKFEGVNYIQYLTKIRMEKAKELIIENKLSIKEIAIEVGYIDQNYFSRAFKKYTKFSPKEYSNKYIKY